MAKKSKNMDMSSGEMDMTSMIDCVFLLIIFFMLVTDLKKADIIQLTLPDADSAIQEKDAKLIINVDKNGDITVGGSKRSPEELKAFLDNKYARADKATELEHPDAQNRVWSSVQVKVRADQFTEFRYIQRVLEICVKAMFYKTSFGAIGPEDKH